MGTLISGSIALGLFAFVGSLSACGGEDEKKDYSGVVGSCTQTKKEDVVVEVDGEEVNETYEYKKCNDISYSGKLKKDPGESQRALKKELCEGPSDGKFSTTTCSRAKVVKDCGSDVQTTDSDNGIVEISTQDFIYEPTEGDWPKETDFKELCK